MRKVISLFILLLSFNSFSQEVFDYEFDDNVTIQVVEDAEEGEIPGGKYVKGTYKNEVIVFSSSDKGKDKLANTDDAGLLKFFQGVKDGAVKSSKGKLLNEEIITLHDLKALKFSFTLDINGKKNIVENYVFVYKNLAYTLQFMDTEKGFDKLTDFRTKIVNSILLK